LLKIRRTNLTTALYKTYFHELKQFMQNFLNKSQTVKAKDVLLLLNILRTMRAKNFGAIVLLTVYAISSSEKIHSRDYMLSHLYSTQV
jgi:hypothetical protein